MYKTNSVYSNLIEYEDIFSIEAKIISYIKCTLLRNEELDDFYIDGYSVNVYEASNGYKIYFADYSMDIEVYDKQIVDFKMQRGLLDFM